MESIVMQQYEPRFDLFRKWVYQGRTEGRAEGRTEGLTEGRAEGRAEGLTQGLTEGRAEGEARSILLLLENRGIDVPEHIRERITSCTDSETLDRWLRRAMHVRNAKELLD